jgi:DNA recombination protein Rad52
MQFTDAQLRLLNAKLDGKHVKTRKAEGATLHYVEGWHVIAEANRIFGHDAWDRRTISTTCVWTGKSNAHFSAAYTAKVRVSVRAGEVTIVREGSGTGEGKAFTPGQAHELALKGAETDATKRALATFGNPFGLALYDREHSGVRKSRNRAEAETQHWMLRTKAGDTGPVFDDPQKFAEALRERMSGTADVEGLFSLWESNIATVRRLSRHFPLGQTANRLAQGLVSHLKNCAVSLSKSDDDHSGRNAGILVSQCET